MENYLNNDMATRPDGTVRVYRSLDIARELGEDAELVQLIIVELGGSHGVAILKGG